jgi:hypothetical protein
LKHGTTKASELIDVVQFYESSVLPDLKDQDGKLINFFIIEY